MHTASSLYPGILDFSENGHPRVSGSPELAAPHPEAQALFEAAVERHVAGGTQQAIALYSQALFISPDYPEAHNNLAVALVSEARLPEAVARYRRAIRLRPRYSEAHNNLAIALTAMGRIPEALLCYARVLVFDPGNADAHYNVGVAMASYGRLSDARASYNHAIFLKPDHAEAHNNLGNVLAAEGNLDAALLSYGRALSSNPRHAPAHNNIANLLRDQGRFPEALAHYDRAIALEPGRAEAHYNRADMKTFHRGDPDLAALETLAAKPSLTPAEAPFIHFALAKAHEDTGDYSRSFEYLRKANALQRARIDYDEDGAAELFHRIKAVFQRELFERESLAGDPSSAPIFVVGMPRSGTTLIEQILASHRDVFGAGELETLAMAATGCFPESVSGLEPSALRRMGAAYLAGVPSLPADKSRFVDKLPRNFLYIGLIHLILPNARILHVTRRPVDTCLSCYSKLFTSGQAFTYDLAELGRYYRRYEDLMNHWRSVLPAGVMHEVSYERVVDDFEFEARRMLGFCGLTWDDRCTKFHETTRPVKTASAVQVRQPLFRTSLKRWRRYESLISPLALALESTEFQHSNV